MACLCALAALPVVRASDSLLLVEVRLAVAALLALLVALVLGWAPLIPAALLLVGSGYAAQLAIDDAVLDSAAPAIAAGLLVTAELAYWSLEERAPVRGEPGAALRHASFIAAIGVAALLVASVLLALVDVVRARGLAVDLLGAGAAAAALFAIVVAARVQSGTRR